MLECTRSQVLLTHVAVLLVCFLTTVLARATFLPTSMSTTEAASPPIGSSSSATELSEPGEATDLKGSTSRTVAYMISEYDAKKFLQNYGYMPTYFPAKGKWEFVDRSMIPVDESAPKTTTLAILDSRSAAADDTQNVTAKTKVENETDSLKIEERTKFQQAIESFQRRYKLQITGSMDEETLRFMQQPRCGVPDYASSFNTKVSLQKAASTADLKGKLGLPVGKSTLKATINNASGALGGTLRSKSTSFIGGRTTVSSPAAKLAARTQESVLPRGASKSATISVSDLLSQTIKPRVTSQPRMSTTLQTTTAAATEITEIVTDIVTSEDELVTTAWAPTTSLTTATTPLLSKFDLPRSRRSLRDVLTGIHESRAKIRTKRQYYDSDSSGSIVGFQHDTISWRILNLYYSQHFPAADLRSQIAEAFRRWAEILPLKFVEMPTGDLLMVDIKVYFVDHTNSRDFNFDFSGEELARSASPWSIHFNDDIQWTYNSHQGKNLIKVAVHEIGHVLGLTHSDQIDSIMFPVYMPFDPTDNDFRVFIDDESRGEAQYIHGVCTGSFDTIFDWVRTVGTRKKYSSVFFRDDIMWLYENANGRVKYGDPRSISDMWGNIPTHLDAALQILPRSGSRDDLYFFKGNRYYQYDNVNRELLQRDPVTNEDISNGKLISAGWPAKASTNFPRIPDNIDTAYFDKRNGNVYFFKGSQVYAYDMQADGCCLDNYPMDISTAYRYRYEAGGLPDNLDAAYYSIHHRKLFFFKGDTFWENETYNPSSSTVVNRVGYEDWWDLQWTDICEV